jgi:putative flippase GtrA
MTDGLLRQIASFLASGVAASGSHYATYVALVAAGMLSPVPANGVGLCLGTLASYFLNLRFTFRATHSQGTFARFWGVTLLGGILNTALVVGLERIVHYALAGLVALAVAAVFNFVGHRVWTFREEA